VAVVAALAAAAVAIMVVVATLVTVVDSVLVGVGVASWHSRRNDFRSLCSRCRSHTYLGTPNQVRRRHNRRRYCSCTFPCKGCHCNNRCSRHHNYSIHTPSPVPRRRSNRRRQESTRQYRGVDPANPVAEEMVTAGVGVGAMVDVVTVVVVMGVVNLRRLGNDSRNQRSRSQVGTKSTLRRCRRRRTQNRWDMRKCWCTRIQIELAVVGLVQVRVGVAKVGVERAVGAETGSSVVEGQVPVRWPPPHEHTCSRNSCIHKQIRAGCMNNHPRSMRRNWIQSNSQNTRLAVEKAVVVVEMATEGAVGAATEVEAETVVATD